MSPLRDRVKKSGKKSGLLPNQGGGSGSRRVVKSKTSILENYFLSDQGVPGVRSMVLVVYNKLSEPHVQTKLSEKFWTYNDH